MARFSPQSLEQLRQTIDLVDFISHYIDLKKMGGVYKALCPFHEERTPSFMIQPGETHFHCFGCHAHGDAIAFLMRYLQLSFTEAVEQLAERYHVTLEQQTSLTAEVTSQKIAFRQALTEAHQLFHLLLTQSKEGQAAAEYLFARGIDWEFIDRFELGYAPQGFDTLSQALLKKGHTAEALIHTGLSKQSTHGLRDFFHDRITIPIRNPTGQVVGFSARKFLEESGGGKYINSPEHLLFKKSSMLFGLSESRRQIAKERKAILVEGQIDALRLIQEGFDYTVASQGTAFGPAQVKLLLELKVQTIYIAFDGDLAGQKAAWHVGDLFQKEGVEVYVLSMPPKMDPDSFLRTKGSAAFSDLLLSSPSYLSFLLSFYRQGRPFDSPALKASLFEEIATQIKKWNSPLMVHESLKKLASLLEVSPHVLPLPHLSLPPKKESLLEPHRALDLDILRALFTYPCLETVEKLYQTLSEDFFLHPLCRQFFTLWKTHFQPEKKGDLLILASCEEAGANELLNELAKHCLGSPHSQEQLYEGLKRFFERHWMQEKEKLRQAMQQTKEEQTLWELAKAFDQLQKSPPHSLLKKVLPRL